MALQSITNLNVDFYDNKHILINAKQDDKNTRVLSIACYNHGEPFVVSSSDHVAYIRYKKADGRAVFNLCQINNGKILVKLTEQMLAVSGFCNADLVIVNRGDVQVDNETGQITHIDNASILSTMTFHINVFETSVDNSDIESSYEFIQFNSTLEAYWADYEDVMRLSKSYAVGNAGGIRENENADNAKYYSELSLDNKNISVKSANAAAQSETNAKRSETNASNSEANAKIYKDNANTYMNNAENYMNDARTSEVNAKTSENNAKASEELAYDYSVVAQRYAVGGTNTVADEDIDNAKYYYEQARNIVIGASVIGVKGANETDYRQGNVNITAENVGAISTADIATVDEIKNYLGI